jgi:hypothetical protein
MVSAGTGAWRQRGTEAERGSRADSRPTVRPCMRPVLTSAVSKAGLLHLTKGMAKTLAPDVRVNAIAPGLMLTEWAAGFSEAQVKMSTDAALLKKVSDVPDVAAAYSESADRYVKGRGLEAKGGANHRAGRREGGRSRGRRARAESVQANPSHAHGERLDHGRDPRDQRRAGSLDIGLEGRTLSKYRVCRVSGAATGRTEMHVDVGACCVSTAVARSALGRSCTCRVGGPGCGQCQS